MASSLAKAVTRVSVIEGLISKKLRDTSLINYLEIGVGEGLTINDIKKEFRALVYNCDIFDEHDVEVSIVSVDPYHLADHAYGDYIMENDTLPEEINKILSYRKNSSYFFEHASDLRIKFDIIFLDGSHMAADILSDILTIKNLLF